MFVGPASFLFGAPKEARVHRCARSASCVRAALHTPPPSFSSPLPLADPFAPWHIVFVQSNVSTEFRPELLGTVLWAVGLYLGLSQKVRWGAALRSLMETSFKRLPVSDDVAESTATALHTLPFLFAGFGIDALLRVATSGNGAWADASGVTLALYGGIYEAGRSSAQSKTVSDEERRAYDSFVEFASVRLEQRGMCHLMDVRAALREANLVMERRMSDEQLRRFIRAYAPAARRSVGGACHVYSGETSQF